MKKILFIYFMAFSLLNNLNAYEIGDKIDEDLASKLNLGKGISVVDFFASWCVSCKKELPLVNSLSEKLNENEVKFIGIDTDEELNEGIAFQKELGLKFFVFNDTKQEVVSKFNPIGMPALYYIKDKKIIKKIFGAVNHIDKVIKKDIEDLK